MTTAHRGKEPRTSLQHGAKQHYTHYTITAAWRQAAPHSLHYYCNMAPSSPHTLELVTKAVLLTPIEFGESIILDIVEEGIPRERANAHTFTRLVATPRDITSTYLRSEKHFRKLPHGTKRIVAPTETRWSSAAEW